MFRVPSPFVLLSVALCMLPWHKAMAEQFSEGDFVYEAIRNKIGLIRYCRNNGLLEPAIADQAISAVVRNINASNIVPSEQGDRAQKAGEDGFWGAGRTRDIDSVAKLFRTTPVDLCQEWAEETLRSQEPERRREIAAVNVARLIEAAPQIEPAPVESPPLRATPAKRAAASASIPPLPERAPLTPAKAEPALLQQTTPTSARLTTTTGSIVSGQTSGTKPAPSDMLQEPAVGQAVPLTPPLAAEAEALPPGEQTVTPTAAAADPDDKSRRVWKNWPFKRLGKTDRCFMPGCKWPASQERQSWGY